MRVPLAEIHLDFVRSSGPGGQNVNKTSSKVQLRWHVGRSRAFTEEEKGLIHQYLRKRLNNAGEIVLASDRLRSQLQNRAFVVEQLQRLVSQALVRRAKRKATRPTRASKERRIEGKKIHSQKKRARSSSLF